MSSEDHRSWVGRETDRTDPITAFPVRGMRALLDRDPSTVADGSPLPAGWHWLFFKPLAPRSRIASDGHERRGGFLPPVPLPRRMWAGGRLAFHRDLFVGKEVRRRSRIEAVEEKEGRSGPLVLVTVRHVMEDAEGVAIEEEQDLVYVEGSGGGGAVPGRPVPPATAEWSERFVTDEVTLFRFSALTFNGHRIHYDHPYATGVERYPGLVVHGPLIALLLLDAAGRRFGPVRSFRYRARSPLFCGEELLLQGEIQRADGTAIWAAAPDGGLVMEATISSDEEDLPDT